MPSSLDQFPPFNRMMNIYFTGPCRPSAFLYLSCFSAISVSWRASNCGRWKGPFFTRLELNDFSDDPIVENEFGVPTVKYASGLIEAVTEQRR